MSDLGWNIGGLVSGVVGILISMVPLSIIWTRLPSRKLPALIALYDDTIQQFDRALEQNLLTGRDIKSIGLAIAGVTVYVDELRETVYSTTSIPQDTRNWWNGVTTKISRTSQVLNIVRVQLAKRCSEARKLRLPVSLSTDLLLNSENKKRVCSGDMPIHCSNFPSTTGNRLLADPEPSVNVLRTGPQVPYLARSGFRDKVESGPRSSATPSNLSQLHSGSAAAHRPTHHVIADADLQYLLSLALAHPDLNNSREEAVQSIYGDLQRLGERMYGSDFSSARMGGATPKSYVNDGPLGALGRLVRRAYGVCPSSHGKATFDLESSSSPRESLASTLV